MPSPKLNRLLKEISRCEECKDLPLGPRPVMAAHRQSKINIVGQAPGTKVHKSGVPWDDASGKTLREWLNVDASAFYNPKNFAILPMGFCYPGKGKSGDLPPRKECAPLWHKKVLEEMPALELTLLIGQYAQKAYLKDNARKNLTENVRAFKEFLPHYLPLPHPSPRNRFWQKKNPWFGEEVVPFLQRRVAEMKLE